MKGIRLQQIGGEPTMKIGFIGAGKVGCTLGKYFSQGGLDISGYFSRTNASAIEAAQFTDSKYYSDLLSLIEHSDFIFITVSDDKISSIWDHIKEMPIQGKFICHCSGSISSQIFSDIEQLGAFGYSIHPLLAIHSKKESYKNLQDALFTVEGEPTNMHLVITFLERLGNSVQTIPTSAKKAYHAAAVFASNHIVALAQIAIDMFMNCGFEEDTARQAIAPLLLGNVANIVNVGPKEALTGPVERNDISTIQKHLSCLTPEQQIIYKELSKILIKIGLEKHPEFDYGEMQKLLL